MLPTISNKLKFTDLGSSGTYWSQTVALCRLPDVIGGPRSNVGRLVGPENEYMAGRNP